jgi:hypothetical protein
MEGVKAGAYSLFLEIASPNPESASACALNGFREDAIAEEEEDGIVRLLFATLCFEDDVVDRVRVGERGGRIRGAEARRDLVHGGGGREEDEKRKEEEAEVWRRRRDRGYRSGADADVRSGVARVRVRDVLRIKTVCGLHSKSFQLPFNTSIPQSSTLLIL